MRKTIAVASTAAALLLGGAGVAHAGFTPVGAPASTTATVAQDDYGINKNDDNNNGLWGLAGLLGLLGLLGLRRHGDHDTHGVTTGSRVGETGTLVAGHGTGSGSTPGASSAAPRPNPGSTPPPTI